MPTKLHPNGYINGKVMTSYRFFKTALVPHVVNLQAKFEVSSLKLFPRYGRVPKL